MIRGHSGINQLIKTCSKCKPAQNDCLYKFKSLISIFCIYIYRFNPSSPFNIKYFASSQYVLQSMKMTIVVYLSKVFYEVWITIHSPELIIYSTRQE